MKPTIFFAIFALVGLSLLLGGTLVEAIPSSRFLVLDDAGCTPAEIATDAGCWSLTTGGSGGAGVPGVSDNALADGNSGSGTGAQDTDMDVGSLNTTGFTGTWDLFNFEFTSESFLTIAGGSFGKFSGSGTNNIFVKGDFVASSPGALLGNTTVDLLGSGTTSNDACFNRLFVDGTYTDIGASTCATDIEPTGSLINIGGTFTTNNPITARTIVVSSGGVSIINGNSVKFFTLIDLTGSNRITLDSWENYIVGTGKNTKIQWTMTPEGAGDTVRITVGTLVPGQKYKLFRSGTLLEIQKADVEGIVFFSDVVGGWSTHVMNIGGCETVQIFFDLAPVIVALFVFSSIVLGFLAYREFRAEGEDVLIGFVAPVVAIVILVAILAALWPFLFVTVAC